MRKIDVLNNALKNAKTKLVGRKDQLAAANEAASSDNSRKNRKALRAAKRDVEQTQKQIEHLSGEIAAVKFATENREYNFPKKAATKVQPKVKKVEHKVRHSVAKPKTVSHRENAKWDAEKEAHRASKQYKGPFVQTIVPNEGMADATEQYLIQCCWESFENGNENALTALNDIVPKNETKDSVQPSEVDTDLFLNEKAKLNNAKKAVDELDNTWQRIQTRKEKAESELNEASKKASIAKGQATKAKKAYIIATNDKQDKFGKMVERNRHARVMAAKAEKRKKVYTAWLVAEEDYLNNYCAEYERRIEAVKKSCKKLQIAMLAKRHERMQAMLEEVFEQRYERAEYIPEKEDAHRYKIHSVKVNALFGSEMQLLDEMKRLATEKPAGWLQLGKQLYSQFRMIVASEKGAYKVNSMNCVINNVAASQMSDIMGVEYGIKVPCKEMISVNYDITGTFAIYWKFIDPKYEEAEKKLRNLRVYMLKRLLHDGLQLTDNDVVLNYRLLASNNSQQKKGQCIMGETETMKRTEVYREFGWTMDEAMISRTDNAAEWLKRNATMTTPSKIIKVPDGFDEKGNTKYRTVSMKRILMVDDIEIERYFDRVTTIDGRKLSKAERKALKITMFDGQAIWLRKGMPTTQGRGAALKFMAIAMPDYVLPEFAVDIMGNKVRIADYDILMTKSCWKASKMGRNWYQFVDDCTAMAQTCEGYDLLRSVRYSDREIGDEENPRNLARQLTQQIIKLNEGEAEKLTRKTRRWLNSHKKFWNILANIAEWDKAPEARSYLAQLFNKHPELIMHPYIRQYLENSWTSKRNKACSGRLRTKGMYPYICQDPIAQIQICLEGRDPNANDLGVVKEGCVNLPKVKEGRKICCVRYPANYIVGMIVKQQNVKEFMNLGNVAVLSYYGDTITRADGDFDGDEMLFIFDDIIIEMLERTIDEFKPSLIDFPHGKVKCDKPFTTIEAWENAIAEALVRAQEFNLVGRYSNLAVICLQRASLAKDSVMCSRWLNAAMIAHVGAVVCLDLVKGADVPQELMALLNNLKDAATDKKNGGANPWLMPWNQIFSHGELTLDDVAERSTSTQDTIAGCIYDDAGKFAIEFENMNPIIWQDENLDKILPNGINITSVRNFKVNEDDIKRIAGCHFEDNVDIATWRKIEANEFISFKDWIVLGWHNSSAILWKMSGMDMAQKRNELYRYIRNVVVNHVVEDKWVRKDDNYEFTLPEKYASMVNMAVKVAFEYKFPGSNGVDPLKKGSFAMFVLRVFAKDILALNSAKLIDDEFVMNMCIQNVEEDDSPNIDMCDIDSAELASIMNDGGAWIGGDDDEDDDLHYYPDELDFLMAC